MKICYLLMASLMTISVCAQSRDEAKFSFDIGVTNFLSDTSVSEVLDPMGYTDISSWKTSETVTAPYIGVNFHREKWAVGVGVQHKRSHDIEVHRTITPYIDRIGSSDSWWSVYTERHFRLNESTYPFLVGGITHATIQGFLRRSGEVSRVKIEETEPFVRVGISRQFKKVQTRIDLTRRFTDTDTTHLIRVTLRSPFG